MAKLIFKNKIKNAPNVYSFIFKKPSDFNWIAGQFVQIIFPHDNPDDRGIKRFFSISSATFEKVVMFSTRIELSDSSSFKKAFYDIKPGTIIECSAPKGKLIITRQDKKILLVAGGIGITPVRAIIFDLDYNKKLENIDLLYSNRDEHVPFKKDFEDIKMRNSTFNIHYFIGTNHIDKETIDSVSKDLPNCYAFISGPPAMVKSVEELFVLKGMPNKSIKTDYFPGY